MIPWDVSIDAQRNILLGWHNLSLGDVATIQASIQMGHPVTTVRTRPHGIFWTHVVRLEWAVEQEVPQVLLHHVPDAVVFKLVQEGRRKLQGFIDYRKLFDFTAWSCAPADRKPPIVFLREGVFTLLDPATFPVNFVVMPDAPGYDQLAARMGKTGRTISRVDLATALAYRRASPQRA